MASDIRQELDAQSDGEDLRLRLAQVYQLARARARSLMETAEQQTDCAEDKKSSTTDQPLDNAEYSQNSAGPSS